MPTSKRILAVECATQACSVALFQGGELLAHRHEILGRGHAERLVSSIAELPGRGRAEEIRVSLGPGSFTGTRIGLAAGRALSIAWSAQVFGYATLALVAAMARARRGPRDVLVAMAGGHGEVFVQPFGSDGVGLTAHRSLPLGEAASLSDQSLIVGSCAEDLVARRGEGEALDLLPDARYALDLPEPALTRSLSPIYGRPPDARRPVPPAIDP